VLAEQPDDPPLHRGEAGAPHGAQERRHRRQAGQGPPLGGPFHAEIDDARVVVVEGDAEQAVEAAARGRHAEEELQGPQADVAGRVGHQPLGQFQAPLGVDPGDRVEHRPGEARGLAECRHDGLGEHGRRQAGQGVGETVTGRIVAHALQAGDHRRSRSAPPTRSSVTSRSSVGPSPDSSFAITASTTGRSAQNVRYSSASRAVSTGSSRPAAATNCSMIPATSPRFVSRPASSSRGAWSRRRRRNVALASSVGAWRSRWERQPVDLLRDPFGVGGVVQGAELDVLTGLGVGRQVLDVLLVGGRDVRRVPGLVREQLAQEVPQLGIALQQHVRRQAETAA